jgi:osmoprotectant transport system ATP-binding protein
MLAVSVNKRRGSFVLDARFELPTPGVVALFGRSGSGKSTLVDVIAGLLPADSGQVSLDDTVLLDTQRRLDVPPERRRIGYVFQDARLFPHLRVRGNLEYGQRRAAGKPYVSLEAVVGLLDLEPLLRRRVHELSGGERQRVGVARALGGDPPVLLMDEPFGAVDPITRQRLQQQFLDLQAELKKTIVFVTHDIDEATKLGDKIAVLSKGGVLEQYDTPSEVLGRPASAFVADFVGADRGVRRLAVTAIDPEDLFHPPEVSPDQSMLDVRAAVGGSDSRWAVVVDDRAHLHGWVDLDPSFRGSVEDHLVPFEVQVPVGTSLRAAFGEMLQRDVRWIPVVDGDRYLGVLTPNRLHAAMRRSVGGHAVEG